MNAIKGGSEQAGALLALGDMLAPCEGTHYDKGTFSAEQPSPPWTMMVGFIIFKNWQEPD